MQQTGKLVQFRIGSQWVVRISLRKVPFHSAVVRMIKRIEDGGVRKSFLKKKR